MGKIIGEGITFDDVLLVPAYSQVIPNQVDLSTYLTKTITADFPLGVSNEFVDAPAKITVGDGTLLALWREQGDFYRLLPKLWDREEAEYAGK